MRVIALLAAAVCAMAADDSLAARISALRKTPDDARAAATQQLAVEIRALPATPDKVRLAYHLASLSTEGDFGAETLQQVAVTLAGALRESQDDNAEEYASLAQLVRFEGVRIPLDDARLGAALARLDELERRRAAADFTLRDLTGKEWTLGKLRGKVTLVNFWATWCPPCRKEIPDLARLYSRYRGQGLVILGISEEDASKLTPFVKDWNVTYPVLRDPEGKVAKLFGVEGIPKSFLYDRQGKLVATAIDMRTSGQFLAMLAKAGML
jgi:peroxiredoxin